MPSPCAAALVVLTLASTLQIGDAAALDERPDRLDGVDLC